ncbi:hypothetical protein OHC33_006069 [Knufia fluminis]|uniref:DUF7371 domain-containing protein n=1 Tax=Knufia fluminis TaxID=191047 RepID=A0AAN8EV81_9EURO|nr:hypothetical protein OHC33_006069 [Knufia fluminis]
MLPHSLQLLLAAGTAVNAAVIAPGKIAQAPSSQPTCGCTATVTEYRAANLRARQDMCPPPATVTVTTILPAVTIVNGDPNSIASSFSYASGIDSIVYQNSIEDRPTGNPPETTSIPFTHTAEGPAIVGTDDPNDSTDIYHFASTGEAPVATTTIWFPPADPVTAPVPNARGPNGNETTAATATSTDYASLDTDHDGKVTITTYLSTSTVYDLGRPTSPPSNLSITTRDLQKRQTCSMIFAHISGQWASWCNNWDGSTVVSHTTYNATTVLTSVVGASPPPESVYNPSHTTEVSPGVTIQTSPAVEPTSTSVPASVPQPPISTGSAQSTSTSDSTSVEGPTSTSYPVSLPGPPISSSEVAPGATSIVITASVVVTYPLTTITQTYDSEPSSTSGTPAASSGCGQVGEFIISFDDLPAYSTSNHNDTASPPIFAPYDHFYWSQGYGYGSPPKTPYTSQVNRTNRIAIYNPASERADSNPARQGRELPGSFGAGDRFWNSVYWFDAKSVYVGCNDTTIPCDVFVTGYRWHPADAPDATKAEGHEQYAFAEKHTIEPPTCGNGLCDMTQITVDPAKFSGLSTINFYANQGGTTAGFYLDSFDATWTNSTCDAGLERTTSRK